MHVQNIEERRNICNECPIYNPSRGTCNPKLWVNPDTNEVSTTPKSGFIRGCGCIVSVKMKNMTNHCVAGKW